MKSMHVIGHGKKCALLISDMQRAYTQGIFFPEFKQDNELIIINKLVDIAHQHHVSVIYTILAYSDYDILHPSVCLQKVPLLKELREGSIAAALDPSLPFYPDRDLLLIKKNTSSFYGTSLAAQLQSQGIDTLIVTGCVTSGCVRATVVDGLQHGFRMLVVEDAVADRWPEAHKQALFEIHMKYGDLIDADKAQQLLEHPMGILSQDK